jgi:hypothetical protein
VSFSIEEVSSATPLAFRRRLAGLAQSPLRVPASYPAGQTFSQPPAYTALGEVYEQISDYSNDRPSVEQFARSNGISFFESVAYWGEAALKAGSKELARKFAKMVTDDEMDAAITAANIDADAASAFAKILREEKSSRRSSFPWVFVLGSVVAVVGVWHYWPAIIGRKRRR